MIGGRRILPFPRSSHGSAPLPVLHKNTSTPLGAEALPPSRSPLRLAVGRSWRRHQGFGGLSASGEIRQAVILRSGLAPTPLTHSTTGKARGFLRRRIKKGGLPLGRSPPLHPSFTPFFTSGTGSPISSGSDRGSWLARQSPSVGSRSARQLRHIGSCGNPGQGHTQFERRISLHRIFTDRPVEKLLRWPWILGSLHQGIRLNLISCPFHGENEFHRKSLFLLLAHHKSKEQPTANSPSAVIFRS